MSEEEIIKEFKNLIYNSDFDYIKLMDEDGFTGWHELFENILDLYNKEKEKNKELTDEYMIQKHLINSDFLKDYISKDKIKEKLLNPIQKEGEKVYKSFMNKKENFEVDGAILQELGCIEGIILEELLGE